VDGPEQHVWSFGDGDYGKLGLGTVSVTKLGPQKVEALVGMHIKKVECGTQLSVFLTMDGKVLTCGMDRLIGRPDCMARSHSKPQQVKGNTFCCNIFYLTACNALTQ